MRWLLVLVIACGGDDDSIDASVDSNVFDADRSDSSSDASLDGSNDATLSDATLPDVAFDAAFDAGDEPTEIIRPEPGALTIIQVRLPGVLQLGEAAVLVGPDGTVVLMDVGNSSHADDVAELVEDLNTRWITTARGFPADRGAREVDWVVITHIHGDHVGAFESLIEDEGLEITQGVVHRGFVDLGGGMNDNDYEELCGLMRGSLSTLDVPLCTSAETPPCDPGDLEGVYAAVACDGLFAGDLGDPLDAEAPAFIALGEGARMTFVAADGHASNGVGTEALTFAHDDNNEENARSLAAVISHGDFRYHWGGDMTGSGEETEPDVESHLVRVAGETFYGALGMDVTHAHHHVRRTSSNATFVDAMAPSDGLSRNVIGGINGGHVGSPHGDVLMRWGDGGRLGEGRIWVTMTATAGDDHAVLVDADADVTLQTLGGGSHYRIQASRATPLSLTFESVR